MCWFFLLVWSPCVGDFDGCGVELAEVAADPISTLLRNSDVGLVRCGRPSTAAITTLLVELLHTHRASLVFCWCLSRLDHLLDCLSSVPDTVLGAVMVNVCRFKKRVLDACKIGPPFMNSGVCLWMPGILPSLFFGDDSYLCFNLRRILTVLGSFGLPDSEGFLLRSGFSLSVLWFWESTDEVRMYCTGHAYHCSESGIGSFAGEAVKFTDYPVKSGVLRSSGNVDPFRMRTIGGRSSWMSMGWDAIFNLQCEM